MHRILLPVCFLLSSCTNTETCEVPLMSLGAEMKMSVISGLLDQKIGYQIKDDGTICISRVDMQRAAVVVGSSVQTLIPRETSQSMDEENHRHVVDRLRGSNIPFTEQQMDGHNFLVWSSSHDAQVRRIVDDEFRKHTVTISQ